MSIYFTENPPFTENGPKISHSFPPFHVQAPHLKVKKAANEEIEFGRTSSMSTVTPANVLENIQELK